MRFVCPSCVATNRCPDACAGLTIICRKCKTQVNVPPIPGGTQPRSWLSSPGWVAVVAVEALAGAGLVASVVLLLRMKAPAVPAAAAEDREATLAPAGETLVVEWTPELTTPGGTYKLRGVAADLKPLGRPAVSLTARGEDRPWPDSALAKADGLPPRPVERLRLHVAIPADEALRDTRALLRAEVELEVLHQPRPGAPLEARPHTLRHTQPVFVARGAAVAAGRRVRRWRTVLRWAVFGCAMVALAVGLGAYLFGQKTVTIMCPHCGRAAPGTYTHEKGRYTVSPCPHSNAGPTAAYD